MQMTLENTAHFRGIGLHSGRAIRLAVHPAPVNHGIWFRRTDLSKKTGMLQAIWDQVEQTALCTRLVNEFGESVSTVEHLMAALSGLGINNAIIDVNGPEIPILDGSAAPFVRGLMAAGLQQQAGPARAIRILRPVEVREGDVVARLEPANEFTIDFSIDFADEAIGKQTRSLNMRNGAFVRTLCDSRTFCRQADVDAMREHGLALGGSMSNAVVFDGDKVLSPGGLRHSDEPVRHKMLDALGDLAMAGAPILGRYVGIKAGHAMTNKLLRALFDQPDAYEVVECDAGMAAGLPGVGVTSRDLALCA